MPPRMPLSSESTVSKQCCSWISQTWNTARWAAAEAFESVWGGERKGFETRLEPWADNINGWFLKQEGKKESVKKKKIYFHGVINGDGEDLTVLRGDAEVADGSTVAFQNTSWFPVKRKRMKKIKNIWHSEQIQANRKNSMWFLTLKNVGSTHARVCPGPRWPARCASRKGQMSWLLCSRWTPSGHVMLGAAASSSAEPSWSSPRNKPPRSQSAASPRRLAAAHDLRGKNRRHENKLTVWQVNVAFNHNK